MGQLTQPAGTEARHVRRGRLAWRLLPVAFGTAAVLAGCGAGTHSAPGVAAVSSAHSTVSHRTPRDAVSSARKHPAVVHHAARGAVSSAHTHRRVAHRTARTAASSAHGHPAISQPEAAGQTAPPAAVAAPGNLVPGAGAAIGAAPGAHGVMRGSSTPRSRARVRTAAPRPGATIKVISGTRNAQIGTLAETTSVVLAWTASEGPIQIFTSQGNLLLSSHARNGTIRLAAGQYRGLHVASPGAWTLRLHAAV